MVWEREDGGTYFPQSCLANRFHAARPLLRVRQERLRDRSAGAEAGRQGTATAHVHEHTRSMQRLRGGQRAYRESSDEKEKWNLILADAMAIVVVSTLRVETVGGVLRACRRSPCLLRQPNAPLKHHRKEGARAHCCGCTGITFGS